MEGSRADSDVPDLRDRRCLRSLNVGPLPLSLGEGAAYEPQMPETSRGTQ